MISSISIRYTPQSCRIQLGHQDPPSRESCILRGFQDHLEKHVGTTTEDWVPINQHMPKYTKICQDWVPISQNMPTYAKISQL